MRENERGKLKRLKMLVAVLALVVFAAAPAVADTTESEIAGVSAESTSWFLGYDPAEIGPVEAEGHSSFLFGSAF